MHSMDISSGCIFEKNCVYLVLLEEHLNLPSELNAISNAKSSIGRLDLLTRLITDFGTEFDRIINGYKGPLYAEINPKSFSVLVHSGMKLNQIRFRSGKVIVKDEQLKRFRARQNNPDKNWKINEEDWRNREKWLNGRLIINPHTAYYSISAYKEMRTKAASNALRIISGMKPFNIID